MYPFTLQEPRPQDQSFAGWRWGRARTRNEIPLCTGSIAAAACLQNSHVYRRRRCQHLPSSSMECLPILPVTEGYSSSPVKIYNRTSGHNWLVVVAVVQSQSRVQLFSVPWTVVHQAPLSMGFCRQEYWSRLPFPSLDDFPDTGIETAFPALAGMFFTTEPPGKPITGQQAWPKEVSRAC